MVNTLPLETWRSVIGYHPYHFWQMADNDKIKLTSKCNSLVREYSYQDTDAAGRSNIREAISGAEAILRNHLRYNVGVHFVEVTIPYPKMKQTGLTRLRNIDPRGRRIPLQLPEGEILAVGKETRLAIDLGATVVLSDQYSDGITDTFTLTVDITGVDIEENEFAIYFTTSDRLDGEPVSEKWRVAPVSVSISGNIATITGRSWLIVKPILYQGFGNAALDPAAPIYVDELAVFKRYADPDGTTVDNSQAVLIWESYPDSCSSFALPCCGLEFSTGETDPAAEGYAVARVGVRNAELGWITPGEAVLNTDGTWSGVDWSGCKEPDRVLVRYQAGIDYTDTSMLQNGANWEQIVSRLAAAELNRPICGCDGANQELYNWQFDLSRAAGANDEQYQISPEDLNNPLGLTRRGAVYAWKQIKNLMQTRAYLP